MTDDGGRDLMSISAPHISHPCEHIYTTMYEHMHNTIHVPHTHMHTCTHTHTLTHIHTHKHTHAHTYILTNTPWNKSNTQSIKECRAKRP